MLRHTANLCGICVDYPLFLFLDAVAEEALVAVVFFAAVFTAVAGRFFFPGDSASPAFSLSALARRAGCSSFLAFLVAAN